MAAAKARNGPEIQMLRELADEYGKQAPLALDIGVDESTVFRWLAGTTSPQARYRRKITDLYKSRRYAAAVKRTIHEYDEGDGDAERS